MTKPSLDEQIEWLEPLTTYSGFGTATAKERMLGAIYESLLRLKSTADEPAACRCVEVDAGGAVRFDTSGCQIHRPPEKSK